MKTLLVDSPVANVANIARALRHAGAELDVTRESAAIAAASKIVLPGVGSFAAAMQWLDESGVAAALREAVSRGAQLLGICVGHQLLFDVSYEMGTTRGLGFIPGEIRQFDGVLPVPQIGWNRVTTTPSRLFDGIDSGTPFYFVNSYSAIAAADEIGTADYGGPFTAAVSRGNVHGVQFHPEKSSLAGIRILANYVKIQNTNAERKTQNAEPGK